MKPLKNHFPQKRCMNATNPVTNTPDRDTRDTAKIVCDVMSVGPHPKAPWSLTFSPSTTSNSTVSPSPTLRRYFRGLFFFIAVLKGRCIKMYYFCYLSYTSPTDEGRAVFLCYNSKCTHQSSHHTKVFQIHRCLLFHRPTNTQFKVSSFLTIYDFIYQLLPQDLLCQTHWIWKLLQISKWTEFIPCWTPPPWRSLISSKLYQGSPSSKCDHCLQSLGEL